MISFGRYPIGSRSRWGQHLSMRMRDEQVSVERLSKAARLHVSYVAWRMVFARSHDDVRYLLGVLDRTSQYVSGKDTYMRVRPKMVEVLKGIDSPNHIILTWACAQVYKQENT